MAPPKKPRMKRVSEDIDINYQNLPDVIEMLQKLLKKVGTEAYVSLYTKYDVEHARVEYDRLENEIELKQRIEQEEGWKAQRRRQYEELKKEFG